MECKACGFVGAPEKQSPGSFVGEIVLWIAAIFLLTVIDLLGAVGIFVAFCYSLYRQFSKFKVCANCKSRALVSPTQVQS